MTKFKAIGLAMFCLFCLAWQGAAQAAQLPPLVLEAGDETVFALASMERLIDPDGSLTIDDVAGDAATQFAPFDWQTSMGYSDATLWFRLCVVRDAAAYAKWVLSIGEAHLNDVWVYLPTPEGGFREVQLGDHRPRSALALKGRLFAVELDPPADQPINIYVRIASTSTLSISATLTKMDAYIDGETRTNLIFGIFYGILFIVILYHTAFGVWLRDQALLAYAFHVLTILALFVGLNGFTRILVPADWPWLNDAMVGFGVVAGAAGATFMWDRILDLRRNFPRIHKLYMGVSMISATGLVFVTSHHYGLVAPIVINTTTLLSLFSLGLTAVLLRRHGPKPDLIYFFCGFVAAEVGLIFKILGAQGYLPFNFWTENSYQMTTVVHLVLLTFGLAHRIKKIRDEKTLAQDMALNAARRAEAELEARVAARTIELSQANSILRDNELRLELARDRAERALMFERRLQEEQRNFLSMLSHEFRTPLAAIDRSAQMIGLKLTSQPERSLERLGRIRKHAGRLAGLIDTFLASGPLETGMLALHRAPVRVADLVERVLDNLPEPAERKRIVLADGVGEQILTVDEKLLSIALGNVVINALRYAPPDSPITIDLYREQDRLGLAVSDLGPGISAEDASKVGTMYYRGQASRNTTGSGLGLFLSRRILESHGGVLDVDLSTQVGCRILLLLPPLDATRLSA